ncbi:MAG: ORF6N domain-containing protein [Muribaculaceae bacterium]|nr:ORF6N domain-containing protein [Muribaculaceae bacterium]
MADIVKIEEVKGMIISLRGQDVILDFEVAKLYGVETKRVNEAVRNNPDKFPEGFIFELTKEETECSRSKFSTLKEKQGRGHNIKYLPKAFTERGLYMLATILKSPIATQTTLAIINTFAEVRELKRTLLEMHDSDSDEFKKKGMVRIGEILGNLIMPDLQATETKTSLEFNFVFGKLKHTITRQRLNENADVILKEKVEFAKRMLAKGYSMEVTIELAGFTDSDIPRLEEFKRNQ